MNRETDADDCSLPAEAHLPDRQEGIDSEQQERAKEAGKKTARRNCDIESNDNDDVDEEKAAIKKALELSETNAKDYEHCIRDGGNVLVSPATRSEAGGDLQQRKRKRTTLWKSAVAQEDATYLSRTADVPAPEMPPQTTRVGAVAVAGIGSTTGGLSLALDYEDDLIETGEMLPEVAVVNAVTRDDVAAELREQMRSEMKARMATAETVSPVNNGVSLRSSEHTEDDEKRLFWMSNRFVVAAVVIVCAIIGGVLGAVLSAGRNGGDTSPDGITIKGLKSGDQFGEYVAASRDGSTIAVGAAERRYVRVFRQNASSWEPIGQDLHIKAVADYEEFEGDLALNKDGTVLAVGVKNDGQAARDKGYARVFWYNGTMWNQVGQTLTGSASEDHFGWRVALSDDGRTLAVSASFGDPSEDRKNAGYVRVFSYSGDLQQIASEWSLEGPDLEGEERGHQFGTSLALSADGQRLAVGTLHGSRKKRGRVQVFDYSGGAWKQVGQTFDGDDNNDDADAVALSADGTMLAIGADGDNTNGYNAGLVRAYKLDGRRTWKQMGEDILGERSGDQFGLDTLSLSGKCLSVGAKYINDRQGKAYLFQWSGSRWNKIIELDGDSPADRFGSSAVVSGNCSVMVVGAPQQRKSTEVGYVSIYQVDQLL